MKALDIVMNLYVEEFNAEQLDLVYPSSIYCKQVQLMFEYNLCHESNTILCNGS